jgi:hypothetical protein
MPKTELFLYQQVDAARPLLEWIAGFDMVIRDHIRIDEVEI